MLGFWNFKGEYWMFQIGDRVVYGIHGVCVIAEQEERICDRKKVTYLVLEPMGQKGSRYLVPAHNAAAMRKLKKLLTPEDLKKLLESQTGDSDGWIRDETLRKQTYRELISSGDREKLMKMVHALYRHKEIQSLAGKKVHLCDENFLRDTENLLSNEISVVLDMNMEDAKQYLRNHLRTDV